MSDILPLANRARILLVDDDPVILELLGGILGKLNLDLLFAANGAQAMEIAGRDQPDMVLLDYHMPDENGLAVLRTLRGQGIIPTSTPVIFITGNDSNEVLNACFQAGASDYIRKPFYAVEILARVRSLLDRKQMIEQLERLASFDTLTGLFNRAVIHRRIQQAIDRTHCQNGYAVLFLDFDRFKWVNDSLGHDVGDLLLKQIANRLRYAIESDAVDSGTSRRHIAARLGGDEFVVLLEDLAESDEALAIAEKLLSILAHPYNLNGYQIYCTASIGVITSAQAQATADEFLRDADSAMYEAKAAGKGRYALFTKSMHESAEQRLLMDSELRNAIANDELFLVYQPIVSLETGATTGFEALMRWNHPTRGLLMPVDFINVAEETGLIVEMGAWAIDRACAEFATWKRSFGLNSFSDIHVNLSRKQLSQQNIIDVVKTALERYDLDPTCLHLEITENEIMQSPEMARSVLCSLRDSGVGIDLDDFGTGYSSLSCLHELPISTIKIDRSFVSSMGNSHCFAAMVQAITSLGQNLGLKVVAEGIETADQLAMLQAMGCGSGQGYYFSRPMKAELVSLWLRDHGQFMHSVRDHDGVDSPESRLLHDVQTIF
jgi:diguanylate cyclase (GGDEF)-like protein